MNILHDIFSNIRGKAVHHLSCRRFPKYGIRIPAAAILLILVIPLTASAKKIDVEIQTDANEIFIGESVQMIIKVSGYKDGMDPDLSQIKDCTVTSQGFADRRFHNTLVINGHRTVSGFSGRIFQYDITPAKTGSVRLGPITVSHKNDKASFAGPQIIVRGVEKQDYVLISIEPSKSNVIVDEPFTVNMHLLIKALPEPYREAPPISPNDPPHLQIPYIDNNGFEGLDGPDIQKKMQAMVVNNPRAAGFEINNFNIGSFLGEDTPARFDLKSLQVEKNGIRYHDYNIPVTYIPNTEGKYTFGPVNFKGRIYIGATDTGKGITKSIYSIAEQKTVNVVPPPEEGRPASYIGAIGSGLSVKAAMDAQTCKVGDPLTLTLEISGDIRLENISAPQLSLQDNITKDFRIYEDAVHGKTVNNSRIYKYTVRPSVEGTLEFPPIEVSFYNPQSKAYETVSTSPIPIRANQASEFQDSTVIDTADHSVTIIPSGADPQIMVPAPISVNANLAESESIFVPSLHIPLLLLGPMIFIIASALRAGRKLLPAVSKKQRQRSAAAAAIKRIKAANAASHETASALREYAAVRLGLNASALTPAELKSILTKNNISSGTSEKFTTLLEQNFNAGFQNSKADDRTAKTDTAAACQVIRDMEVELCRKS
jgi:hypothetical protein